MLNKFEIVSSIYIINEGICYYVQSYAIS